MTEETLKGSICTCNYIPPKTKQIKHEIHIFCLKTACFPTAVTELDVHDAGAEKSWRRSEYRTDKHKTFDDIPQHIIHRTLVQMAEYSKWPEGVLNALFYLSPSRMRTR